MPLRLHISAEMYKYTSRNTSLRLRGTHNTSISQFTRTSTRKVGAQSPGCCATSQDPAQLTHVSSSIHRRITSAGTRTVRFLIRWFLMRRANHSEAVAPVLKRPVVSFAAASAISALSSASRRSTCEFPGLVKKTRDHRSYLPCSFGGGLYVRAGDIRI